MYQEDQIKKKKAKKENKQTIKPKYFDQQKIKVLFIQTQSSL